MSGSILIDTGPLVAVLAQSDQHHQACVEQLRRVRGQLFTCWPVLTEAAWLLQTRPGAVMRLLKLVQSDAVRLLPLDRPDLPQISTILASYQNLRLQLADASLLHLASREGIQTIFTLDRRDFRILRLASGERLHIIP